MGALVATGLPAAIVDWLEARHAGAQVTSSVGGGFVNPAVRLRLPGGDAFLKYDTRAAAGMFAREAEALAALRSASAGLRIPEVLDVRDPEEAGESEGAGCLLLEWLEPTAPDEAFGQRLGTGLAHLHRVDVAGGWGWERDGFIGPLPQPNAPAASWVDFWRERRLAPQLERARGAGWRIGKPARWDDLFYRLPDLLAPAEIDGPSLLHGDLWSGNVLAARDARGPEPALVDPSAYRGHREVDLAMAELFGGFPGGFLESYHAAWPLQPGYVPARRACYQLYYLLVHVNLFGGGYVTGAERALSTALA